MINMDDNSPPWVPNDQDGKNQYIIFLHLTIRKNIFFAFFDIKIDIIERIS
jgi:hypothetical protein